jgi:hypothetical protein
MEQFTGPVVFAYNMGDQARRRENVEPGDGRLNQKVNLDRRDEHERERIIGQENAGKQHFDNEQNDNDIPASSLPRFDRVFQHGFDPSTMRSDMHPRCVAHEGNRFWNAALIISPA